MYRGDVLVHALAQMDRARVSPSDVPSMHGSLAALCGVLSTAELDGQEW